MNGHRDSEPTKGRPKKYEMIICENTPQELPPDVIRSDSKVEDNFDNLAVNLANIRNRFEKGSTDKENGDRRHDKSQLVRSESILLRLQKYQSAVMGEREPNSSSDDEMMNLKDNEHQNEIMALSGQLSSLKSQWETGSVVSNKEETDATKEELENLRKNLSLGRKESLKQVYERAIKDGNVAKSSDAVVLDTSVKTNTIKEKFEKKNIEPETEEQRSEKLKKERDEEFQAFTDSTAKEARNKFKEIDASATKSPTPQQNGHTNGHSNGFVKKFGQTNGDVIKSGAPASDDVSIDSGQLQERFSYFENLPKEVPKESKRHQITPPREVIQVSENNVENIPDVVRSSDVVDDIPKVDTTKKMLNKFKALESQPDKQSICPKPLKRITPPREVSPAVQRENKSEDPKESVPERDPNIVRSSLKDEEPIQVEPEKARSLKAKFENWSAEIERQNSKNNDYDEENEFIPHIDTTKNLRKKFEAAVKEDNRRVENKPKRVNRFVCETGDISPADLCYICRTKLYPMEKLEFSGIRLHKNCFRCIKCKCNLRLDNFTITAEKLYCIPHFKQLFMEKGNYDEGFGQEQHKDKWNNKCINNNDLIINNNNNTSQLICDENANQPHIVSSDLIFEDNVRDSVIDTPEPMANENANDSHIMSSEQSCDENANESLLTSSEVIPEDNIKESLIVSSEAVSDENANDSHIIPDLICDQKASDSPQILSSDLIFDENVNDSHILSSGLTNDETVNDCRIVSSEPILDENANDSPITSSELICDEKTNDLHIITSELICDEKANESPIVYSNQSASEVSDKAEETDKNSLLMLL